MTHHRKQKGYLTPDRVSSIHCSLCRKPGTPNFRESSRQLHTESPPRAAPLLAAGCWPALRAAPLRAAPLLAARCAPGCALRPCWLLACSCDARPLLPAASGIPAQRRLRRPLGRSQPTLARAAAAGLVAHSPAQSARVECLCSRDRQNEKRNEEKMSVS